MKTDHDVIIIGGGLVGPLIALALDQAGISSAVVDALPVSRTKKPDFDGRAYALSLTSIRVMEALGIWAEVRAHAEPMTDIKISHGHTGKGSSPFFAHFDHREIEEGPFGHMLEDRYLRRALIDAMGAAENVSFLPGHRLLDLDVPNVTIEGPRGGLSTLIGHLVAGCDGRSSKVAEKSGITRIGWDYGQTSLVCAVAHEKPHNGTAYQYFTQTGPLAILPLPGNRSSIVWTETTERAEAIMAADEESYLAALRPVFGDFLGPISLAGDRFSYPLGLSLASRFVENRVVLAGDAAHGIHPLAGQGLNLGVRDAAALAEVIVDAHRRGEDFGAANVLARYQRWRRFDTSAMAAFTDGVNRVFRGQNPVLRMGRDLAMQALREIPPLRRTIMREAAGLNGDLPRLMAGRPI